MVLAKSPNLAPHMGKRPQDRPSIIVSNQGSLWKCPVCFTYNPIGHVQCSSCCLKNPAMMGGPSGL